MPSAYSCESATPSRRPQRDLRISADAVAVSNDLHSCSRPQAILKVRHLRSLDYRPCQRSCLLDTQLFVDAIGFKPSKEKLQKVFPALTEIELVGEHKISLKFSCAKDTLKTFKNSAEVSVENWKLCVLYQQKKIY